MRIFKTSTMRFKEIDEIILDEQGAFKTVNSLIYSIYLTAEEWAVSGIDKYVREAIENGIKVYSGLARTGKLEICDTKILHTTQYMIEFVISLVPQDAFDKAEYLEDLMRRFAKDNRELLTQK